LTQQLSKKAKRQEQILKALELDPAMRVNDLARRLDVSQETVRRDLSELDDSGRIKRTYGGAIRATRFEPHLAERLQLHIKERERIAQKAVELLGDHESLFVGGGSTTFHFARALKSIDRRLTVLTPSFGIATELASNTKIEVLFLPGQVEPREGLVHGPETLEYIGRYRTPLAVVGATAVDEEGVSEALLSSARVYQAMVQSADRTFVLADSSKMGGRSLRVVLKWNPNVDLLTDTQPSDSIRQAAEDAGAQILVAP
jgi:DeoR/GlpR family transcriptional regulator of sugar metabolism